MRIVSIEWKPATIDIQQNNLLAEVSEETASKLSLHYLKALKYEVDIETPILFWQRKIFICILAIVPAISDL